MNMIRGEDWGWYVDTENMLPIYNTEFLITKKHDINYENDYDINDDTTLYISTVLISAMLTYVVLLYAY